MHKNSELTHLFAQLPHFAKQIQALADQVGLDITPYHCDHLCLRCHDLATAERWHQALLQIGEHLSQNWINGRPILLFGLFEPILLLDKLIDCIELPYPTGKRYPQEGWEHIELVLPVEPAQLATQAMVRLSPNVRTDPAISIRYRNPKAPGEKVENPTLAISNDHVTIKFHPYSIRHIIAR